ncbi:MAG: membrane protein insertase YidC [Paludibacteraceae bacterium]|nr:membrane protein insertase YidC [Paludibacteraceae bacterium]
MNKNTVFGFLIIGALLFGFAWYNKPTQAQLKQQQQYNDSIAAINEAKSQVNAATKTAANGKTDSVAGDTVSKAQQAINQYGAFAPAATGQNKLYTIENKLIKLTVSSKGGQIVSVQLKNYKTNDGKPLFLFDSQKDSSSFGFNLVTANNRLVRTNDMYFDGVNITPASVVTDGEKSFTFRLKTSEKGYIDYTYTLKADDYMIGFTVKANQMETVMPLGVNSLELQWNSKIKQQERSNKFENRYAAVYYKHIGEDMDNLSQGKDDQTSVSTRLKWVAFKDQFFSSILIADDAFTSSKLSSKMEEKTSSYLKDYKADMNVAFDPTGKKETGFRFYFGPNKFQTLHHYDKGTESDKKLHLEKLVPLGWGIFGWINQFVIIPLFNFFSSFITSFGIIILLLTIVIKIVIFPLTYKSYLSTAKMRVLKPQIDEIHAHIPASKAQERQQATMALYKKVGVNPMGGCLPMLLQMPILFAMFSFFPAAIELRQQSFLWAKDLSSYDAVLTWNAQIPLLSQYFGNHLSLFCLLMTITNLVYTHINMQTSMDNSQQMPGMKYVMYLMPVVFLFMFNDYASGLSYYYFIATLITILQTIIIRNFVDEDKLLQQLHENAKNPKKQKKSGFLSRLEDAQRKQVELQKQKNNHKK